MNSSSPETVQNIPKEIMPPTNHPMRLKLNALVLPKDEIMRDNKKGPSPLPRSSMMLKNEFALPLVSGRVTLVNIALSMGIGKMESSPERNVMADAVAIPAPSLS